MTWLEPPESQDDFWQAVQRANSELEADGLYLTHLFREVNVIIQPDWITRRVRLDWGFAKLIVFRPATIDLILTKMARGDDDDMQDVHFLIRQEAVTADQLIAAFDRARVPDIAEIQDLFDRA